LLDLAAQRRLAEIEYVRGAAEMKLARDGRERTQQAAVKVHARRLSLEPMTALASASLHVIGSTKPPAGDCTRDQEQPKLNADRAYDVVVVGGGTAGACAAIASARTGAKTLVLEPQSFLGGTLSLGMNFLGAAD